MLLAAILYKTVAPSQAEPVVEKRNIQQQNTSTIQDPLKFIETCYQKYISASLGGKDASNTQAYIDTLNNCFTTSFVDESMLSSEESGDPVVHSQTFSPDWSILLRVESTTISRNEYRVILGSGTTQKKLLVTVVVESNALKINKVLTDDGV